MAQFELTIPDDFLKSLGRLADVEKYAPQMIEESIPILQKSVQKELEKHKRTGMIVKSVKPTKVGYKNGVFFAVVRPTGKSSKYMGDDGKIYVRKKAVRNMEIVAHLEYGTDTQPATPIMKKAYKDAEPAVLKKMQEVFEREAVGS